MPILPDRPNLDHLKKQAKDLLRRYRNGDSDAAERFCQSLPAAAGRTKQDVLTLELCLRDAQSCVAREYGFSSWSDLNTHVEVRTFERGDEADRIRRWLFLVYGGDVAGQFDAARPRVAARLLRDDPDLVARDPHAACAAGDIKTLVRATAVDPAWVNRVGGALNLPPLVAVTHSRLGQLPEFEEKLRQCARHLLDAGADPNQAIGNRFPPASLATPDEVAKLSALYGAAGVNRDPILTGMLLEAGADPNDGESLYHSVENPECTDLLLRKGARVTGTNALRRALDMPDAASLGLLLAHGGDPNEPAGKGPGSVWGAPLLRAIALRRSTNHIATLLKAGADPQARTPGGIGAFQLALQVGLVDVAELLKDVGVAEDLTDEDLFVAACARADLTEARRVQTRRPDLPASLPNDRLRLLPDTIAWGGDRAARAMVEVGWPIAARGADWDATALNVAVFRGGADMTAFRLAHGASWREGHGYGADVIGTLSWASINEPTVSGEHDWAGCARALSAHGLPPMEPDPSNPERILIGGRPARFSPEVTDALLASAGTQKV